MARKSKLTRRSFLTQITGGAALTGAGALVTGCASTSNPRTGYTDSDGGRYADRAGHGRGPNAPRQTSQQPQGRTDWDPQDRPGQGVGGRVRRAGCIDADSGPNADPTGRGTRC